MKLFLLACFLIGGLFTVAFLVSKNITPQKAQNVAVNTISKEIPVNGYLKEATLYTLKGGTEKLSEYHGKPLIINVWASWCGPCREEMASLNRLAQCFHGKQFNIIGVSTDDDTTAAAAYANKLKLSFPVYLDSRDFFIEGMLGASAIPLTVLVAADGRILDKVPGALEWDDPEIVTEIGKVLSIELPRRK